MCVCTRRVSVFCVVQVKQLVVTRLMEQAQAAIVCRIEFIEVVILFCLKLNFKYIPP